MARTLLSVGGLRAAQAAIFTRPAVPRTRLQARATIRCSAAARPRAPRQCRRLATLGSASVATNPSPAAAPPGGTHAVVIGAGLAGLTAAKALSSVFERVTCLERDGAAALAGDSRPGVPQFTQPHVLLTRGLQALDKQLPGFSDALRAAGGQSACFTSDFWFYDYGILFQNGESNLRSVLATRGLVEKTARSLVTAAPGVELRAGAVVTGLQFEGVRSGDAGAPRVTGVQLADGTTLAADLVVDASGRSSKAADWMAAAGLQRPDELILDAKLGYATRQYKIPTTGYTGRRALFLGARPWGKRGAVIIPVEGNRWQVIITGFAGDLPPITDPEMTAYLQSMPSPLAAQMLKDAKPLTPWSRYLGTRNQRRLFEAVPMPAGLVVLGDAVASFNPIYGQGITTGVLQSAQLGELLQQRVRGAGGDVRAGLEGLPDAFQRAAAGVVSLPWDMAIAEDAKWEVAKANYEVPKTAALLRPYFAALAAAASKDLAVFTRYARVMHMVEPPTALFHPQMLAGALWYGAVLPFLARLKLVGRRLATGARVEAAP